MPANFRPDSLPPGIPSGTTVTLSYSVDGGITWNYFLTAQTNSTAGYLATWYPPYPNTYSIRANWSGDQNYQGSTSDIVTIAVSGTPPARISLLVSGPSATPRGSAAIFNVLVDNAGPTATTTLFIEVTGPSGYRYFDTLPIMLTGGSSSRFQFTWQVPTSAVSGDYQVVVGLIPPISTSFSSTQITVT